MFKTSPLTPSSVSSPFFDNLRAAIATQMRRLWEGSSDLSPSLRLEQRFASVRWIGITVLTPTLPFFDLPTGRMWLAYGILFMATIYNLCIQILIQRRSPHLSNGYITTIGDGMLSIAMILAGGGFDTSFNYVLYTTTMAAAMRYGWSPSMIVISLYFVLDASVTIFGSGGGINGDFVLRTLFLVLTVVLASYLQDQARLAEAALANQLERARALNESSRSLSSSLELPVVMKAAVEETRCLMNADVAILHLDWNDGTPIMPVSSCEATSDAQPLLKPLTKVMEEVRKQARKDAWEDVNADNQRYVIVPVTTRSGGAGYLGVLRNDATKTFGDSDLNLLSSFVDRSALAIENASLYKTIDDRSHDLKRAYADLADAHQELLGIDEMKTNFIANVSHELRTPLTSIRSFSELLMSYAVDENTRQEFLGIINTESERLTRLINDVLDITKIEAGQVEWQMANHSLTELLTASARSFSSLVAKQGLAFNLDTPEQPVTVQVDRDRIQQVLANLLGNAVKFTREGAITLGATVSGEEVRVYVHDTGIGIAPQYHHMIFEKFHQVGDTLTDKPHGTGLGLSICKDIIEIHGGQIFVESELGQGSAFIFTLPLQHPEAEGLAT